ncbi:MAG: homocysteine S-methyltransferase family protein, partial [Chitinophagales bacterium]
MGLNLEAELKNRILILDGAMGTMLQQRGLKPGECPEMFNLTHPEVLEDVHRAYVLAGADIIQTNTFGGNRLKLAEYGMAERVEEVTAKAVAAARRAAENRALVAVSVGPTGKLLYPTGSVYFDDLYEVYSEQTRAAEKAGADLISFETMTDIGELRAAVIAARDNTSLPILAHLTFEPDGRTMMGTDPVTGALILESLGVMAVGANCSGGARQLLPLIARMANTTNLFISVEPNAGLPSLVDGVTVFPESPEEMAIYALELRDAGANIIGGCCGTTPDHIKAMAEALKGSVPIARTVSRNWAFCSRSRTVFINNNSYPAFIGERINPTARKKLAEDIREDRMEIVVDEARKQVEAGAPILDVNMGVPGIDEPAAMTKAVLEIQAAVDVPISIDSTNPQAMEAALKSFVGRPLINSTT